MSDESDANMYNRALYLGALQAGHGYFEIGFSQTWHGREAEAIGGVQVVVKECTGELARRENRTIVGKFV